MKKFYYLPVVAVMLLIVSCTTYRQNYLTAPVYSLENTTVTNGLLETDIEIIGKLSATIVYKRAGVGGVQESNYVIDESFLSNTDRRFRNYVKKIQAEVLYKAVQEAGCDILLAPIYTLNIDVDRTYTISVKGIGANINGIRQIKTK